MEEMAAPIVSHGMLVNDQSTADALDEILGVPVVSDLEKDHADVAFTELRALKPDVRPQVGKHYVIYGGKPMPVVRDSLTATEDEFVRDNLFVPTDLKDHDGQRQARADRTLRLRYRGYVCGEMTSL